MKRTPCIPLIPSLLLSASLLLPMSNASAGTAEKNPAGKETVQVAEAHPMYLGTINAGIKTNDAYTDGNFSIVAPLWSTLGAESTLSGGLLFLEPYISYGEGGEVAASLGLGYRHLFGTQSVSALTNHDGHQAGFFEEGVFIGANVFVDMLDTESDNQFWQLGVGLEAGTRYLEARGNYYIPLSDKQLAEEFRTREQFQTTSTQTNTTGGALGDPFATGNAIVQNTGFTTTRTTTTSTTTIERLFRRYEEGMEGWDAELALLVPGLDKYFDLRFIGGYYSFDNQPFGPQEGGTGNVEGWKAGVEIRPVPAVILSGTWYEDERLTGSDWTAGVQLQVPFEMGDLGDGKGFWDRIGDAFTPRRRHLVERLAEPVHRQNAAVKIASSLEEEEAATSTSVKRVTKVVASSQGQLVLADDVVFVNNGEAVGNGIQAGDTLANGANGTAEHPFDTISAGATRAGTNSTSSGRVWSVYTQATGAAYSEVVQASGSTKFISSYTPIIGSEGSAFGGNTARPILSGGLRANSGAFIQMTGYHIQEGGANSAILAANVQNLVVTDNIIDVERSGITYLATGAESTAYIAGNQISTGLNGVVAQLHGDNNRLSITVTGNDVEAGITGVQFRSFNNQSKLEGTISGNRFLNDMVDGAWAESHDNSTMLVSMAQNEFSGTFSHALQTTSAGTSTLTATIEGNTLSGTFTGFAVYVWQSGTGSNHTADFLNNTLSGSFNGLAGVFYSSSGGGAGKLHGTLQGNVFSGAFGTGVWLASTTVADVNITIAENVLSGAFFGDGIYVMKSSTTTGPLTTTIRDNTFSGSFTNSAINYSMPATSGSVATATITGNRFEGSFERAIHLDVSANDTLNATVTNNLFTAGSSYGIEAINFTVGAVGSGTLNVTDFSGNLISGTAPVGISITEGATGTLNINGDLNNQVTNESGNKVETTGAAAGSFYLNDQLITLPQTVP